VSAELPILSALIRRTRRRALWQTVLAGSFQAVTAALGAAALLLVLGTGIVAWYVPLATFAAALAVVLWRLRGRLPGDYCTAQSLDAALHTCDLLSSAWHVRATGARSFFAPVIFDRAENAARTADPAAAWRWHWPRSSRWAGGMALAVLALFGLRYGLLRTLDLSSSVVHVMFDTFAGQPVAATKNAPRPGVRTPQPEGIGLDLPGDTLAANAPDDVLKNYEVAGQTHSGALSNAANPDRTPGRESGDSVSPEDSGEKANLPEGAQNLSLGGSPQSSGDTKKQSPASGEKKDSGLLDRMRDALASMLDKLKPNSAGAGSQQTAAAQNAQRQNAQGPPSPGRAKPGDPQNQPSSSQADSAQGGEKSRNESPSPGSDDQQHSGIGKQDGAKNVEMAKDAAALGKLSELIGKRSLNLQGEMMVEVENTRNPQLRTPYLNRSASHTEAGGDLSRDEVPLRHQEFVRRYYEQVRRQPDSLAPVPHKPAKP